jgi:hypothetical protein
MLQILRTTYVHSLYISNADVFRVCEDSRWADQYCDGPGRPLARMHRDLAEKAVVAVRKVGNYSRKYQSQQISWTLVTSDTSPSLSYKGQPV